MPGPKCAVRTSAVVVRDPLTKDRTEMRLGQRDHPVQALAPDAVYHSRVTRPIISTTRTLSEGWVVMVSLGASCGDGQIGSALVS